MADLHTTAIVLAGGKGTRMHSETPKQYMLVNKKPVLFYSLRAFERSKVDEIILVAAQEDIDRCRQEIVQHYGFSKVTAVVAGGAQRYDSVMCGLNAIDASSRQGEELVLIHDGARPCITTQLIENCIQDGLKYQACIAAVPVKDTIKMSDQSGFCAQTPDRNTLWQIQTPQVFNLDLIRRAYEAMLQDELKVNITDDAMVVENYTDVKVKLTMGTYDNMKITTPEDIAIAECILKQSHQE